MKNLLLCISACLCFFLGPAQSPSYQFDSSGISPSVLNNYLDRSITMVYLLSPERPEGNRTYPWHADDIRMVKALGAKFIGRSIYRWGGEDRLNDPAYWDTAKSIIVDLHRSDPDMILQACLFEIITEKVDQVPIPSWVFRDFGLPLQTRNFSYQAMLNKQGRLVGHWGKGSSVPDISEQETRLWFYFLAGSYIDLGCEGLHLGQVDLIGINDPNHEAWSETIHKIREYAKTHARRHWVLLDAHVPRGGMQKDGHSLLDFNSFPLRIKPVADRPFEGCLQAGYLDAIYGRSQGGITPSGWTCDHLPFLVEFDNFGHSHALNIADTTSPFIWGWDEISWFAQQPAIYRNGWLIYATDWLKKTDPHGHLEMPGNRMLSCPNASMGSYRANAKSENCPMGYSQEQTIGKIWGKTQ